MISSETLAVVSSLVIIAINLDGGRVVGIDIHVLGLEPEAEPC